MARIFSDVGYTTETWTATGATLQWGGGGAAELSPDQLVNLVLTGVQLTFQRRLSPIYPLASASGQRKRINLASAPSGVLVVQGMIGPNSVALDAFLAAASKPCKTKDEMLRVTITPFGTECTSGTDVSSGSWILDGLELSQIGLTIRSAEVATIEVPLQFEFTGLTIEDTAVG